jgi:hypothetical protein
MSVYQLHSEKNLPRRDLTVGLTLHHELYDLADAVLKTRAIRAFEATAASYPIHRIVRCAARRKLELVFDDLALKLGFSASRLDEGSLLLDGDGVFIQAEGRRKSGYCSCSFLIWTTTPARADTLREQIFTVVGDRYERHQMFTIDWHFTNNRGLSSTAFDELVVDTIFDEAYPTLGKPVVQFIEEYLHSPATVLILQGPPGTGKTRLVRAILSQLAKRREETKVMYTGDRRTLESDEIFVDFITGSHAAFVIEDADHLLLARSNGNHDLHRFLTIADGVVRSQGRKIIFTTNLPNVSDIDEALLRPGRCFATVQTRALTHEESTALLHRIADDPERRAQVLDSLSRQGPKVSIASLYRALE